MIGSTLHLSRYWRNRQMDLVCPCQSSLFGRGVPLRGLHVGFDWTTMGSNYRSVIPGPVLSSKPFIRTARVKHRGWIILDTKWHTCANTIATGATLIVVSMIICSLAQNMDTFICRSPYDLQLGGFLANSGTRWNGLRWSWCRHQRAHCSSRYLGAGTHFEERHSKIALSLQ
jgi:hypothetical protein